MENTSQSQTIPEKKSWNMGEESKNMLNPRTDTGTQIFFHSEDGLRVY